MRDEKTEHKGYPLPHRENQLVYDVERLREALNAIDSDIHDAEDKLDNAAATDEEVENAEGGGFIKASQSALIRPKTATDEEVEASTGDGYIKASQASLIKPAAATTTTAGIVKLAAIPTDDDDEEA